MHYITSNQLYLVHCGHRVFVRAGLRIWRSHDRRRICYLAKTCIHSAFERCGINDKGELRRFIDSCDMLEYNCLKNSGMSGAVLGRPTSSSGLQMADDDDDDDDDDIHVLNPARYWNLYK
ncbi:hypothetical protein K1T71_012277 [Dendrolimus kikuchii]|uniref:Uncharacterized protein n=1 Tax=Dendrolimus kikuchii TaxID=765133 RepID=A0ACC1CL34_9NEOP|nr:hypothetical protein K1T71_012277 [Dendrolimus kikuchii]